MARQAIDDYRRTLGDAAGPTASAYVAGRLLELVGSHEEALEAFQEALNPGVDTDLPSIQATIQLLEAMARCARQCRLEVETARWLGQRAVTAPLRPELLIWQGYLLRLAGRLEEAGTALEEAVARVTEPPFRILAATEQLQTMAAAGRFEEAQAFCRDIGIRFPEIRSRLAYQLEQILGPDDSGGEAP